MAIDVRKVLQTIKRIVLSAGLVISMGYVPTAMAAVGGTPAYQREAVPFQWIDASTGTKQTTGAMIPIGFDFQFYGVTYNSLSIGATGTLDMMQDVSTYGNNIIMPYWDSRLAQYSSPDSVPPPYGGVYRKLEGSAPNRKFTVSWIDWPYSGYPCEYCELTYYSKVSFQATLYEGSNDIVYRYLDVIMSDESGPHDWPNDDNGANAQVGVRKIDEGTDALNRPVNFSAVRYFMGGNLSPIADAGPDLVVNEGVSVTLNGSRSSDSGGSIARYYWWLDNWGSPYTGNTAIISTIAPEVTSDSTFWAHLWVTDNQGAYSRDQAIITVSNVSNPVPNASPVANAGPDITVNAGAIFKLNGSGTDTDGTIVKYLWDQSGPGAIVIAGCTGRDTPVLTCTAPTTSTVPLTLQLTVTDNAGASHTDSAVVTVLAPAVNQPPVANAGPDQTVKQKTTVTLNGSSSSDPDGSIASYSWKQVAGKTVTLKNATSAKPTFTAPETDNSISMAFELTVTDNKGATAKDQVVIKVTK